MSDERTTYKLALRRPGEIYRVEAAYVVFPNGWVVFYGADDEVILAFPAHRVMRLRPEE